MAALPGITLLVVTIWILKDALIPAPQPSIEEARQKIALARARWDARPFSHYRLVYQISSGHLYIGSNCQRDLEISNEELVQVYRDDCPKWSGGTSVTAIFKLFMGNKPSTAVSTTGPGVPTMTPYVPLPTPTGSLSCPRVIVASYDSEYGYPHSIKTEIVGRVCSSLMMDVNYAVKIISLTPIP